eukprot:356907-Chlamydomonas_euryale.AAC.11
MHEQAGSVGEGADVCLAACMLCCGSRRSSCDSCLACAIPSSAPIHPPGFHQLFIGFGNTIYEGHVTSKSAVEG